MAKDGLRRAGAWMVALFAPLLLWGCVLTPGKFAATLDIRADRSFTFTYAGEVIVPAPESGGGEEGSTTPDPAKRRQQIETLIAALSKEYGYRSITYAGDDRLIVDYRVSGRLTHGLVFPFNPDAEVLLPFLLIELRGKDSVRVKAPGFAADGQPGISAPGMGSAPGKVNDRLDGTFTLTTDGEIVSQNQENGAQTATNGREIIWRATPQTKDAPLAVIRVAPLP